MSPSRLYSLPVEIRDLIWSHVGLAPRDVQINKTCKFFQQDRQRFLSTLDLSFLITPGNHAGKYPSGIDIRDQERHWETIHPSWLDFSSPQTAYLESLCKSNFGSIRQVRVEIEPPDQTDPGQFIRLWNCTLWLMDLFRRCTWPTQVQNLRFVFKGDPRAWARLTIRELDGMQPPFSGYSDIEYLLWPINMVRGCEIDFELPQLDADVLDRVTQEIDRIQTSRDRWIHFGDDIHCWSNVVYSEDSKLATKINTLSTWLDMALGGVEGETAAMLRLERMAFWSDGYRNNFFYRVESRFGRANIDVFEDGSGAKEAIDAEFEENELARLAYNPRVDSFTTGTPCPPKEMSSACLLFGASGYIVHPDAHDCFEMDAWFTAYPAGIPSYGSPEFLERVETYVTDDIETYCRHCFAEWCPFKCRMRPIFVPRGSILCQSHRIPAKNNPRRSMLDDSPWHGDDGSGEDDIETISDFNKLGNLHASLDSYATDVDSQSDYSLYGESQPAWDETSQVLGEDLYVIETALSRSVPHKSRRDWDETSQLLGDDLHVIEMRLLVQHCARSCIPP